MTVTALPTTIRAPAPVHRPRFGPLPRDWAPINLPRPPGVAAAAPTRLSPATARRLIEAHVSTATPDRRRPAPAIDWPMILFAAAAAILLVVAVAA